jgi:hypothetical protein
MKKRYLLLLILGAATLFVGCASTPLRLDNEVGSYDTNAHQPLGLGLSVKNNTSGNLVRITLQSYGVIDSTVISTDRGIEAYVREALINSASESGYEFERTATGAKLEATVREFESVFTPNQWTGTIVINLEVSSLSGENLYSTTVRGQDAQPNLFAYSTAKSTLKNAFSQAIGQIDWRAIATSLAKPVQPRVATVPVERPEVPAETSSAAMYSAPEGTSPFAGNSIAIVIGNKDYSRVDPVIYAQNDMNAFASFAERTLGIPANDIWKISNASLGDFISLFGTEQDIKRSRLYRTTSLCETPPNLIVYYSGHGAPGYSEGSKVHGYLVPVDSDLLAIQNTGYSIDTLIANIEKVKAEGFLGRVWLCFDSCFSGQSGDGKLLVKNVSGLAVVPAMPKESGKDFIMMFAASGEQYASWYPKEGHGLFTYFLLKAFDGGIKGKTTIALSDLASYLGQWVPRFSNGLNGQEQVPSLVYSGDIPNFVELHR